MGFFSGIASTIGKVFKAGSAAVKTFGGGGGGLGGWGTALNLIGSVGSSLMTKKAGGSGDWAPVDTSAGGVPNLSGYYVKKFDKAGSAKSPNMRMKTVDGDTLTAEWEYRLKKSLRDKNLFS
jgi:hypothetical protein|tara:strand:- start:272 stop:637 length:366 start_codon:yes stop_codon:yes gene_type:complete